MKKKQTTDKHHPGWKVRWQSTASGFNCHEIFTGPDGTEYRRTNDPALMAVTLQTQCGPLLLKRRFKLRGEHQNNEAPEPETVLEMGK